MTILRQSTVSVINFGPVIDKGDFLNVESGAGIITSFDHATTGILISKNGGTLTIREQGANFVATTYDAHGCFKVSLSAVDTNTAGRLRVIHTEPATFLPTWRDFIIIPASLYDTMFVAQPTAAILKFFDVAASVLTCASVNQAGDAHVHADAIDTLTKASGPGDLAAVFAGVVTNAAGTDVGSDSAEILTRLPDATAGAANGLPVIDATGAKLTKTVDLTAGQSIAVNDKTGFALAATGADLILKSSTFILAVADAVWDEVLHTDHEVAGSASVLVQASGGAADPLLNPVPGAYAPGSAGYVIGTPSSGSGKRIRL
jgi:hypothetical protein